MTSSGPPKAPTIKDVAQHAGVSFKTVSRVMNRHPSVNPKIRDAVQEAMRALNYRPHQAARALRSQRSYSIALLTGISSKAPETAAWSNTDEPHYSEFLGELTIGCALAAKENGYHLIYDFLSLSDRHAAGERMEDLLSNLRPDGIILAPPLCDASWLLDILEQRQIRYARLLPGTDLERGLSFVIDDFGAAKAVTHLLLDAGHRQLAMIAGPSDHIAASERRRGFEAAVQQVSGARSVVVEGDFLLRSGRKLALQLLRSSKVPTAIFAANDAMAAGAATAAAELGIRIPTELSLAGFDDALIARTTVPPLTSVRQPTFEIATEATAHLAHAASTGTPAETRLIRVDYSISVRQSIAPLPSVT